MAQTLKFVFALCLCLSVIVVEAFILPPRSVNVPKSLLSTIDEDAQQEITKVPTKEPEFDLLGREPKVTWEKVALSEPEEQIQTWNLKDRAIYEGANLNTLSTLKGKFLINGLASCAVGDRLVHPFEAHGFIKSIEFHGNGTVTFRSKYVDTFCTSLERAVKRPLFRGVMSSAFAPPLTFLNSVSPQERNTANLACRSWPPPNSASKNREDGQTQLIVGGDNSAPYALDIETLASKGVLSEQDNFADLKNKKLLAHTRYDSKRQRLIMAACDFEFEKPGDDGNALLQFWEYDINGKLVSQKEYRTDKFMVMHDWTITDNYYVVPKNPAMMEWANLPKFLSGYARGVEVFSLDYLTNGGVLLIPRHDSNEEVIEAKSDTFFNIFHIASTYEQTRGEGKFEETKDNREVVMHGVVFDSYKFGREMGFDVDQQEFDPTDWSTSSDAAPPRLDRFVIDCSTGEIKSRERMPLVSSNQYTGEDEDVPVDMPTFHPLRDGQKARYNYFIGGRQNGWFPFRSLVKMDLLTGKSESWDAGDGRIVSEMLFLPRGQGGLEWLGEDSEDDGFLISVLHNADDKRCELAVMDAQNFAAGPIALLDLGNLAPWSVHGHWVPKAL